MPYRKRNNRRRKRRNRAVPSRNRSKKYQLYNKIGNAMPNKFIARLTYNQDVLLESASLPFDSHVFRANGCYDPDFTLGGNQPRYFDQLMLMYYHFTVIKSKCVVRCINRSNTVPSEVTICTSTSALNPNTPAGLLEYPGSRTKILGNTNGTPEGTISNGFNAKYLAGKNILDNHDLRGDDATDPQEQSYFIIMGRNSDSGATTFSPGVNACVQLTYTVIFTELKLPAMS